MRSRIWQKLLLLLLVLLTIVERAFSDKCCHRLHLHEDELETTVFEVGDSSAKTLRRQKRNFGGSETINFPLVYDTIFGVRGWLVSGIEAFQDILFHVSGYTVLGKKHTLKNVAIPVPK